RACITHMTSLAIDESLFAPAYRGSGKRSTFGVTRGAWGAYAAVLGVVAWNALSLRAEWGAVPYLNDSSVHEQMVRFATAQFQAGHLPLTRWFPYLGLGSPQFLHYQSLPAMIAGVLGVATGP